MRTIRLLSLGLLLPLAPARGAEGAFVDPATGLVVSVPDGWRRDLGREHGGIRFTAILDLSPTRYVLFTIEAGPAAGYDEERWLANEKASLAALFDRTTLPFRTDPAVVAGATVSRYTVGGRATSNQEVGYGLRVRGAGFVTGDLFFRVTEMSYNGAHEGHEGALEALWNGIGHEPAAAEPAGAPDTTPPAGEPTTVVDEKANFKLTLPPGWRLVQEPAPDPDTVLRLHARRENRAGERLAELWVTAETETRATVFSRESAGDRLKLLRTERGFFEEWYGEGSAERVLPRVDESVSLGGAATSAAYELRGLTAAEVARVDEARQRIARGDKSANLPEYDPLVLRGRLALLSPRVYHAVAAFHRGASDSEPLVAEVNAVLDSWTFLDQEERPPPLVVGKPWVERPRAVGDTTADPACAEDRVFAHRREGLAIEGVVPAGFRRLTEDLGGGVSVLVVAQDGRNNWVRIALSHRRAAADPRPDRREICESWRRDWTGRAHGVERMDRPQPVRLGPSLDGDGYEDVAGTVERFRGTFTGLVQESAAGRTIVEMETRGDGDEVFAAGIETFFEKLELNKAQ